MIFYFTVIITATIILITSLTFIGYILYNNLYHKQFPPVSPSICPDYWISKDNVCYNSQNLGTCGKSKNFNHSQFKGNEGLCNKKKWANICGVAWNGITNNQKLC